MLFRFTVMMYGGKIDIFVRETSRSLHCTFRHGFCFLGVNYCNLFYNCSNFGSLGEVFAHGGEFPLAFLIVGDQGHGVETIADPSL